MNLSHQPVTHRGTQLLVAHLDCLDPKTVLARERLDEELGSELARKLLFALSPHRQSRHAA
jgi:hypothetical protein